MGRFVTRDPIGYKGGINLYGFCGNNPVNDSDPSGYQAQPDWVELERGAEKALSRTFLKVVKVGSGGAVANVGRNTASMFGMTASMSVGLFFMSTKSLADDSNGPLDRERQKEIVERGKEAIQRNGGKSLDKEGYYQFPNRQSARQAASEIAGDLGSDPVILRVKNYRGVPRNLSNSNTVMGRRSSRTMPTGGSVSGWRDDFLGHDRFGAGPHVNAWNGGQEYHLHY